MGTCAFFAWSVACIQTGVLRSLVLSQWRPHAVNIGLMFATTQLPSGGPVSVLRSREAEISKGEFYWILSAASEHLSDKFLEGDGRGWGHIFYM